MPFSFKKKVYHKVVVIGAGKVAIHLAPALENAGHQIVAVYSRRPGQAESITQNLYEAAPVHTLNFADSDADVFILAVSDDAIYPVTQMLRIPSEALLLHTSGSKAIQVLDQPHIASAGVLYPLQTFSPGKLVNFRQIPLVVEGNSAQSLQQVMNIARSLSEQVLEMDSAGRLMLHAAAVFACNFSNHMLHIAEKLLEYEGIDFKLIKPLIEETYQKAMQFAPSEVQTGPALRNDRSTMESHVRLLSAKNPDVAQIYQLISKSIQDYHQK